MTQPISQERITWLQERLKVVEESLRIAHASMYGMRYGGSERDGLQRAVLDLGNEHTKINLELKVLESLVAGASKNAS